MVVSMCDKYFVVCMILVVTLFSLVYNLDYYDPEPSLQVTVIRSNNNQSNASLELKYILLWTNETEPIKSNLREGNISFRNRKCPFTNCYMTSNRQFFGDVADFDVILFNGRELPENISLLPQSRSPNQKYIYANMESSANFPVCNQIYKSYFNWTWTYKLDSDEIFGYMSIRDKEGNVIGPKEEMHWMKVETMMPINDTLKEKLSMKKIAAAWFVSHCGARSGRDLIAKQLQAELARYDMQVDIFGRCGTKECPRGSMKECLRLVETDYYFYLSFENSFADDYVTEKLLNGLNHYAVPVVLGGANYTRFVDRNPKSW